MNWVNVHEQHGLWSMIDKINMILAYDMYRMVGYKSDTELV